MLPEISRLIQKFGLRDKEARVFLCCLVHKTGLFAHEIVKETGINRSTVDVIVQRLLDTQWITKTRVGQRYKYIAQDPRSIHARHQNMLENLEKFFPFLDQFHLDLTRTEVRFYEGASGIEMLYNDLYQKMRSSPDVKNGLLHITSSAEITNIFPGYEKFVLKRIGLKIPVRILAHKRINERIWLPDPAEFRDVKTFPAERYPFNVNFDIYSDRVYICSILKPIAGFAITNPQIANAFRQLFSMVWDFIPQTEPEAPRQKTRSRKVPSA